MRHRLIRRPFSRGVAGAVVAALVACEDTTAPPVARQLAFTTQPATAAAGQPITPAIEVAVLDADGNVVKSASVIVTLSIVTPNSDIGDLSGLPNAVAVNGVATFRNVSTTWIGAGFRLKAAAVGLTSAVSNEFEVTFGPAEKLAFTVQPLTTGPGAILTPPVVVEVRDAFDNTVTTATNTITVAIAANRGGGILSGTTSVQAQNGVATFSDLSVDNAGESYMIVATSANLVVANSSSFDIRSPIVFTNVSAGYFHTCGLATGGSAYCWGENSDGQLGGGPGRLPAPVSGGLTFASVSAGRSHSCGVTTGGAAYCWGSNSLGQLGTGGPVSESHPMPVSGSPSFVTLTAGYSHTCGVTAAGAGYCWGDNSTGELGNGLLTQANTPALVSGGPGFSTLSPGRLFSCGLSTDNMAYCWGDNSFGELGDGTKVRRTNPVPVSGQLNFAMVGAGGFHACGLTTIGAAYCWGDNTYGQLGNGSLTLSTTPVAVSGGRIFASISAGNRHTCAVTPDGAAYCWGDNSTGHLGTGTENSSSVPVAVSGGLAFASVKAGRFHTCGVTTAGAGYCWGDNGAGKLGDGTTVNSLVPIRIR